MFLPGCGADDHPNEPRPAKPITVTAIISESAVSLSPDGYDADDRLAPKEDLGAGLVTVTVTNQSEERVPLVIRGPVDKSSRTMTPGSTAELQVDLKPGDYRVEAGDSTTIDSSPLHIGPARKSSQNELLLP